jgi:hypothetical protein
MILLAVHRLLFLVPLAALDHRGRHRADALQGLQRALQAPQIDLVGRQAQRLQGLFVEYVKEREDDLNPLPAVL